MSFRRRITLVSAAAVAIAVVLASLLTYLLASHQLHSQVDAQLRDRGRESTRLLRFLDEGGVQARSADSSAPFGLALGSATAGQGGTRAGTPASGRTGGTRGRTGGTGTGANPFGSLPPEPDQVRGYQQVVGAKGTIIVRSARGISLPVDAATRRLAAVGGASFFTDAHVDGTDLRILAEPLGSGRAVQYAQPLTEVDSLLGRLRLILALLDIGGIALAALLGRLVAGAAVLPLKRLTQAAEHVALTQDLSGRIELASVDELGRLASSFNAMLDALEHSMSALDTSVHAQRQLVADASHELRTPVTSLRTNIEILQREQDMEPDERRRLIADVVEQIGELTILRNDLIELARGEEPSTDTEDIRFDVLVGDVAERTRRHSPETPLLLELAPTLLAGSGNPQRRRHPPLDIRSG